MDNSFNYFSLKIFFVIFIPYFIAYFGNLRILNKIEYKILDMDKYKETVNLEEEGILEIFKNENKKCEIETKTEKIFKSEIIFLIIPGGSYKFLGYPETYPITAKFFSLGYSSALLKYSVAPKCYPANYNQGMQAIKILSPRFKKIIIIGFSAGGHLAGLLGTTEKIKSFNVAGMILCYPVISFYQKTHILSRQNFFGGKIENNEKNQKQFSIEYRVNSETLPTFIWTLRNDTIVPYENTLFMIQKLKENNVTFESKIYNGGRHGIALADETDVKFGIIEFKNHEISKWVDLACNFIEKVISEG